MKSKLRNQLTTNLDLLKDNLHVLWCNHNLTPTFKQVLDPYLFPLSILLFVDSVLKVLMCYVLQVHLPLQ